jgi:prepilin-type N-terminal cleavage/methylation domain-containing protein
MIRRAGFTLVELLVVIAIIGILVALLLPAIQFAREGSRRTACINNLKQVGLAAIHHENVHRFYASRAESAINEGSWITDVMPFMEESALYNEWAQAVGRRSGSSPLTDARPLADIIATPIATLYCPSRRPVAAYPVGWLPLTLSLNPDGSPNYGAGTLGAKTDYALNGGASTRPDEFEVKWPGIWQPIKPRSNLVKPVRYKDVKDGLSKTYLIAEKSVSSDQYTTGRDQGDNYTMFDCARGNCVRFAKRVPEHDRRQSENCWACHSFGSAHPSSFNAVYCDGSIHSLTYDISFSTHAALASRAAGDKVNLP